MWNTLITQLYVEHPLKYQSIFGFYNHKPISKMKIIGRTHAAALQSKVHD